MSTRSSSGSAIGSRGRARSPCAASAPVRPTRSSSSSATGTVGSCAGRRRGRTGTQDILLREYRLLAALESTDVPHPRAVLVLRRRRGDRRLLLRDGARRGIHAHARSPAAVRHRHRRAATSSACSWSMRSARWPESTGAPWDSTASAVPTTSSSARSRARLGFDADARVRTIDHLDVVAAWLEAHRPHGRAPAIMHGDYQFANVMFRPGVPDGSPRSSTGSSRPSAIHSSTSAGCSCCGTSPVRNRSAVSARSG